MHLYIAVFASEIPDETRRRANLVFDDVYQLSDRVLLVRMSAVDSPTAIRKLLGLSNEPEDVDAIFKLNGSYAGYNYSALWDWMAEATGQAQASG